MYVYIYIHIYLYIYIYLSIYISIYVYSQDSEFRETGNRTRPFLPTLIYSFVLKIT